MDVCFIVMRENHKTFFKELFTSVILSLYPVSYLYQLNSDKLLFKQTVLPFVIVGVTAFTIFLFFRLLRLVKIQINNLYLTIPILSIILFFYGFFFNVLHSQYYLTGFIRNRYVLPMVLFTAIFLIYFISSIRNQNIIKLIISFLIVLNILPYLSSLFSSSYYFNQNINNHKVFNDLNKFDANPNDPDIYYIVLDMYPSNGVLKKYWKFDNSKFLTDLNKIGFNVFNQSKSNYPITYLALNSILNMDYVQSQKEIKQNKLTNDFLIQTLAQNRVSVFLKNRGYNYYIFEGGIIPEPLNKGKNDYYLSTSSSKSVLNYKTTPDNDFYLLFINNSIFFPFVDRIQSISSKIYRKRIYYVLEELPKLSKQPDKKFVIAHIMCPHSPFIFGENGEEVFVDENSHLRKQAFINQLKFINRQIIPVMSKLINSNNGREKIIILQGDHGTRELKANENYHSDEDWVQEYYGNFNSVYFSSTKIAKSYYYVAPVNTFRHLFNRQFDSNFKILPDSQYYSDFSFPLKLFNIKPVKHTISK